VTVPRGDSSDESWYLRATGGDWQHFHRDGWYVHEDTSESLLTRADDRNDLRIGFYFRMDKHRAEAVQDQQLQFNFRNMGSNPSEFTDIYDEQFEARTETIRQHVADTEGTLTGNKRTKITATYDIPVASHDGFFEAYTAALHEAFVDFVVESPELIRVLTEAFEDAVKEFGSSGDTEVE
jgi:hypothetical protein